MILGLDTATPTASVALVEDGTLIAEQLHNPSHHQSTGNHAATVLPLIQSVLSRRQIALSDLSGIALSIGPGSFTGLRIALATVKGIAYEWGVPVAGVSTLLANAARVSDPQRVICSLMDARKREVYAALYERRGESLMPLSDERVCPIVAAIETLREIGAVEPIIVGDGAGAYQALLRESLGAAARITTGAEFGSLAAQVALLAERRMGAKQADDVAALVPRYLRSSEAEKKSAFQR